MFVDINGLDNGRSKPVSFIGRLPIPQEYSFTDNALEAKVEGVMGKSGDVYVFKGRLDAEAGILCAKCLKPVTYTFDIELDESFSNKEGTGMSEEDEVWAFTGTEIDLTEAVLTNVFLAAPYRVLCGESCKGLCPVCGCDLNERECGCDRSQPDSRFESLKAFFNDNTDPR